jgi:hypothetical protein
MSVIEADDMIDAAKASILAYNHKDWQKASAISSRLSASLLLKASNRSNLPQRGSEPRDSFKHIKGGSK